MERRRMMWGMGLLGLIGIVVLLLAIANAGEISVR
jgi:hypothetical protein